MEINLFSPHVDVNNHKFCLLKDQQNGFVPSLSYINIQWKYRYVIEEVRNIPVPQEQA